MCWTRCWWVGGPSAWPEASGPGWGAGCRAFGQSRLGFRLPMFCDAKYSGQGGSFRLQRPPTQRREIDASSIRLSSEPADLPRGPQSGVRGWRPPRSGALPHPHPLVRSPARFLGHRRPPARQTGQRGSGLGMRQASRAVGRRGGRLGSAAPRPVSAERTQAAHCGLLWTGWSWAARESTAAQPAGPLHTPHAQGPQHSPGRAPGGPTWAAAGICIQVVLLGHSLLRQPRVPALGAVHTGPLWLDSAPSSPPAPGQEGGTGCPPIVLTESTCPPAWLSKEVADLGAHGAPQPTVGSRQEPSLRPRARSWGTLGR